MLRKIASLSVALIVTAGVMVAVPAEAATKISNGVACKKAGTTSKTSFGTYKCGTNPLSTSKKLVWLSTECISAATGAVKAAETAKLTAAKFKEQIPVIDLGIRAYGSKIKSIETDIKRLEAAKLAAQNKPAELALNVTDSRDTAKLICTTGL
jgi:hypothetical protein